MTTPAWTIDPLDSIGLPTAQRTTSLVAEVAGVLLLTEGRADASQVGPGDDPRGWWHDGLGEPIGSTIWVYQGEPLVDETLRAIEQAAVRALQPMAEDGIAASVTATATANGGRLDPSVAVTKPDGVTETLRWPNVWVGV